MTLLEELGLTGPIRSLSEDDRLTYSREVRRRYLLRPGKKEMVTKRMSEYRGRPEVCEQTAKTRRAYKSRPEVKRKAVEQFTDYRRRNRDLVNKGSASGTGLVRHLIMATGLPTICAQGWAF